MQKPFLLLAAASSTLMAGCAQTQWMKFGATAEETQLAQNICAAQAAAVTAPSDVRFHRQSTFGREVAAGLIAGLVSAGIDALKEAAQRDQCMMAAGFRRGPVQPETQFAAVAPAPTPLNPPSPAPTPPVILASTAAPPAVAPPSVAPPSAAPPAAAPLDRRRLMTEQMMRLTDATPAKTSFLLGACSAGDQTACILSEMEPGPPPRTRRRM